MPRWLIPAVLVFLVVFGATWAIADAEFLLPVALFIALVLGFLVANQLNARRVASRPDGGKADSGDPIPSAAHAADDERPLGDTAEAHDEISPHDLPVDHPGRKAAERQAGGSPAGTTEGDV